MLTSRPGSRTPLALTLATGLATCSAVHGAGPQGLGSTGPTGAPMSEPEPQVIELAICLDTSGSMDGLIDAAKQKLWAIVNDLALAEPTPRLRVALLTYGNDGHDPERGWVAVETGFTEDLDLVSQKLFALTTNGGTELVGRVLHYADGLDWHPSGNALELVIVAGNESAEQDTEMPFPEVCKQLITKGVMVNAIYCGPIEDEIAPAWKQVALLADGQFAAIDHDEGTVVIETPFDEPLAELSASINTTYLPYGRQGATALANQAAQDANAANLNGAAAAQRCSTKGGSLYQCGHWDLVDATRDEAFDLDTLATEDLPESMRGMTREAQRAHIEMMRDRRAGIQARIAEVSRKREAFVQEAMKQQAIDDSGAFDNAVRGAVRSQAVSRGFHFADITASKE